MFYARTWHEYIIISLFCTRCNYSSIHYYNDALIRQPFELINWRVLISINLRGCNYISIPWTQLVKEAPTFYMFTTADPWPALANGALGCMDLYVWFEVIKLYLDWYKARVPLFSGLALGLFGFGWNISQIHEIDSPSSIQFMINDELQFH